MHFDHTTIPVKKIINSFIVLMIGMSMVAFSQTAPNTLISNQARASYKFKTFPADTVRSNILQFTVLDAPNFKMSISTADSFVFNKETVSVYIVYTNIGNKIADTATINGVLPPAGMKFVPGSSGGSISGSMVSWKIFNVPINKSDSVKVNVVVDSNLTLNTQLQLQASLHWLSSTIAASQIFVVSSFPRLMLSVEQDNTIVGSGRVMSYRITVTNSGNSPSVNTVLYDTISAFGLYATASISPDSISSDQRLIKWNLGSLPPFTSKELRLDVVSAPNIGNQSLSNGAFVFASNETTGDKVSNNALIIPIVPKTISIVPDPVFVFGQVNKDSSRISVIVRDSLNELMPDGVTVQFSSTLGSFSNNAATFSTVMKNGIATAVVHSINVVNDIVTSTITATGGNPLFGTVRDSTLIHFYPGAVTGTVVNGVARVPFQGAIARVYNSSRNIVGADTTKSNGKFFIALNKDVDKYELEIVVIDKFGDSIKTTLGIDPTSFPIPPIVIPNTISGRIEYAVTGEPVPAADVTVFLDSIAPGGQDLINSKTNFRNVTKSNVFVRLQEQKTDLKGKFTFKNLKPAKYVISVDSIEFPNFKGFTFVADTGSGTFTFNLSLQITLDSNITFLNTAPPLANAGDTVSVGIMINNNGTAQHRSVSVRDTLSKFVTFLSATKGKFTSVNYDSAKRIVSWQRDTLNTLAKDSMSLRYIVARNIPDSTRLGNTIWFSSNILSTSSSSPTTIHSIGSVQFANSFVVLRDTIIAGDSIRHVFRFKNVGTDSLRNIRIVDTLFSAGLSGISLAKSSLDSTKIVDSISTVYIGSIAPEQEDSVSLKLITDFALQNGISVSSHAYIMTGDSILARRDTSFVVNENPNLSSFFKIVKTANKKVAEIGDIVTYQVQIQNASPQLMHDVGVYDLLPYAFQYVKNSARFNGRALEPTIDPALNQLRWIKVPDTIYSSKNATLVYQLAVGADAMESEGMNTAYASAEAALGTMLVSAPSQWQVTVRPGVFSDKGLIIGKVFYDDNRNTFQDASENGEKGIELWMEDGTKIITGDDGKFSLPEVKPGQHVMRVNESTLPLNSTLLVGNNAFAKDPSSRFVRVTEGGIAKANFYLHRTVADSIKQSVAKVNKVIAVRQVKPKYVYKNTLRNISIDTVEMFVSFAYSGNKPVRSIQIKEKLHERISILPNSASFNGKRVQPVVDHKEIEWNFGPAGEISKGVLKYKAVLSFMPGENTVIPATSIVRITAIDSIVVETGTIVSENVVLETTNNRIETSEIVTGTTNPRITNHLSDSVTVTTGDEIFLKTSLFIDPKKNIKDARIIDTMQYGFIINERSFTVNGIPIPQRNLSVRIRSMALSSTASSAVDELEFMRITSLDATNLLRGGMNEVTFSARLQSTKRDTIFKKRSFAIITDEFDIESIIHSDNAKIFIEQNSSTYSLMLETTYVNIPRLSVKLEEKIADAVQLIQSLRKSSTTSVVMEGISFENSKSILTEESKRILDPIAKYLVANPDMKIQINGYTDNTGNASANILMSLKRAREVAQYLIDNGVNSSRVVSQGFGSTNPIASNKTQEGRAKNRRVEFAPLR